MDSTQVSAFVDYLIGWRSVGVAGDEEILAPNSPEMLAFIVARLGNATPRHGHDASMNKPKAAALAELLREVATGLDGTLHVPFEALARAQDYLGAMLMADDGRDWKDARRYLEAVREDWKEKLNSQGAKDFGK